MIIRKASVGDIDLLIQFRIDYLLEEQKVQSLDDIKIIKSKLRNYLSKWIPVDGFIAFIAEDNNEAYSTAFLSIVERPPRNASTSYLVGTVYNVFTYPQHRGRGIATQVMSMLLGEAKSLCVSSVDLLSTKAGRHLYEKLGFVDSCYDSMRIKL
jgi:GNAT superfamily N-acetyltransferase